MPKDLKSSLSKVADRYHVQTRMDPHKCAVTLKLTPSKIEILQHTCNIHFGRDGLFKFPEYEMNACLKKSANWGVTNEGQCP